MLEAIQYNSALAITGAIRRISTEKLYHELGFRSFGNRRWYRKHCCLYKIFNSQSPKHLLIRNHSYFEQDLYHHQHNPLFKVKHNFFRNSLQKLFTVLGWNKRDLTICKSENVSSFKNKLLQFICPSGNNTFTYHNPEGIQ